MALDFAKLRESLGLLRDCGLEFFDTNEHVGDGPHRYVNTNDSDVYWELLEPSERERAQSLQKDLLAAIQQIGNSMRLSALVTEADRRDLGRWIKSLRASLRLREYAAWDLEVLHDEGTVLGVKPPGQSDSNPVRPALARRNFDRDISNLLSLVDLIEVSPALGAEAYDVNPQATTEYKPGTAFVMMRIDPAQPNDEDVYETIKSCFASYGIKAIRADEIEHEDTITARILQEIKASEFLIADLTGERPSVYYEIGYAHSHGRRVILYRQHGTRIHFDLAAYNCPEYRNITELRKNLMGRLESVTGRKSKQPTK